MLNLNKGGKFQSHVNECEDIKQAIQSIQAQSRKSSVELDFELESVSTYRKSLYDKDYQKVSPAEIDIFLTNKNNLLEPTLLIKQRYSIALKPKAPQTDLEDCPFIVKTDKENFKAFVVLLKGFTLRDTIKFEKFYQEIRKQKALQKIIFVKEDKEKEDLWNFLKTLRFPLVKEEEFCFLRSVSFVPTKESNLEFKRAITGDFETIEPNELICEFHKPMLGKPGRNVKGEYVIPEAPATLHDGCSLKFDEESINVQEFPDRIEYRANVGGILKYEDEYLFIQTTLETKTIDIRTTGSLIGGLDSGTTVNVTESDTLREAIGQGMKVQASKVNVEGNVGPMAEITANDVTIGGMTHQESKIFAKNVNVKSHKGFIEGDIIKIDSLETGIVKGNRVEVKEVYGGKIFANEIVIENLHSNAFLYATRKIEINRMIKGENKFFIGSNFSPENREKFTELLKQKNTSVKSAIHMTKQLKVESLELKKFQKAAEEIRNTLIEYKQAGKAPPTFLLKKFEEYRDFMKNLKEKREKINQLSEDFKQARDALADFDSKTKEGEIIVHSGWVGYNEVHYHFYTPENDMVLIPKVGEPPKVIFKNGKVSLVLGEEQ
ncbi:MAG: DUF342 domain-containing protein [Helicobacter sp.]|nr:DUF342 domain-containing protein [Helicobacter sp.]